MRLRWIGFITLVAWVLGVSSAQACLWDYDTLRQEAARRPSTFALLAGKFNRHSSAFYEWRIEDRLAKLASHPAAVLPLMDDLAVAYEKTGRTDEGIALMREALALDADRYETHANLGTLLVHAGRYAEGLEHLKRAVEINPEAHFGRERWQVYLVEYVITKLGPDGKPVLPLGMVQHEGEAERTYQRVGFRRFLESKRLSEDWPEQAIRGIEGMMRFGRHDSPILNEALGDLVMGWSRNSEQRLAVRAYLKAAASSPSAEATEDYRLAAGMALSGQQHSELRRYDVELALVESEFARETAEGDAWFAQITADEARWVAGGGDPEAEFDAKYQPMTPALLAAGVWWEQPWGMVVLGVAALGLLLGLNHWWNCRRRLRGEATAD